MFFHIIKALFKIVAEAVPETGRKVKGIVIFSKGEFGEDQSAKHNLKLDRINGNLSGGSIRDLALSGFDTIYSVDEDMRAYQDECVLFSEDDRAKEANQLQHEYSEIIHDWNEYKKLANNKENDITLDEETLELFETKAQEKWDTLQNLTAQILETKRAKKKEEAEAKAYEETLKAIHKLKG